MTDDDVLFVPIKAGIDGSPRAVTGQLEDGRVALYAYSTPGKLSECCGEEQRRARVDMPALDRLKRRSGRCDVVILDAALPDNLRLVLAQDRADAEERAHTPQSWLQQPVGRRRPGR